MTLGGGGIEVGVEVLFFSTWVGNMMETVEEGISRIKSDQDVIG